MSDKLMEIVNEAADDLKNIRENKGRNKNSSHDDEVAEVMKNVADSIKEEVSEEYSKTTTANYVDGAREMFESLMWFNKLSEVEVTKLFGDNRNTLIDKINNKKESPVVIINRCKEFNNLEKDIENLINTYGSWTSKEILGIIKDHLDK